MAAASEGPIFAYRQRLRDGTWRQDPIQELAVEKLQLMHHRMLSYRAVKGSTWLERLRGDRREPPPEGLYLHGGVGRGKTVLMDLVYGSIGSQTKRRMHFHAFMLDVHARIHAWRQLEAKKRDGDDPIRPVAKALSGEATLLCLDELQVTDVADAMILRRLFSKLFQNDVVVVTTSNIVPDQLYAGGSTATSSSPSSTSSRPTSRSVTSTARPTIACASSNATPFISIRLVMRR